MSIDETGYGECPDCRGWSDDVEKLQQNLKQLQSRYDRERAENDRVANSRIEEIQVQRARIEELEAALQFLAGYAKGICRGRNDE